MRFWVITFLMVLMPLQFSWAATGQYCQHEKDISSKHLGHHVHQHPSPDRTDSNGDLGSVQVTDADCGTCHAGCSIALPKSEDTGSNQSKLVFAAHPRDPSNPVPPDIPDRPQWTVLA